MWHGARSRDVRGAPQPHSPGEGPYTAKITALPKGLEYRKELLAIGDSALDVEPDVSATLQAPT